MEKDKNVSFFKKSGNRLTCKGSRDAMETES